MKITLIEPFYTGSHKRWADDLAKYFTVNLLTMPGRHWKWRMNGAALSLSEQYLAQDFSEDLLLGTSLLDMNSFLALTRKKTHAKKTAIYFHENQFAYPSSKITDERDLHYPFIQLKSALSVDKCFFNSSYNLKTFVEGCYGLLKKMPDFQLFNMLENKVRDFSVLPLGMHLSELETKQKDYSIPIFLWNHRWEHDKNPELFFRCLKQLKDKNLNFKLIVLGQSFKTYPRCFDQAKHEFADQLLHFGPTEKRTDYINLVKQANIMFSTSAHDFFGMSVVEALAAGCIPLLPNDLAYPEHFNKDIGQFFNSQQEAETKLEQLVRNFPHVASIQSKANDYDWQHLEARYRKEFNFS